MADAKRVDVVQRLEQLEHEGLGVDNNKNTQECRYIMSQPKTQTQFPHPIQDRF